MFNFYQSIAAHERQTIGHGARIVQDGQHALAIKDDAHLRVRHFEHEACGIVPYTLYGSRRRRMEQEAG